MTHIINETMARDILATNGGKFITIYFQKKDGSIRKLNGRTGVKKYLRGGKSTIAGNPDLISIWDNGIKQYRCFNIRRLLFIKSGGKQYSIAHSIDV